MVVPSYSRCGWVGEFVRALERSSRVLGRRHTRVLRHVDRLAAGTFELEGVGGVVELLLHNAKRPAALLLVEVEEDACAQQHLARLAAKFKDLNHGRF